jgi:addiction module HigA family antidote
MVKSFKCKETEKIFQGRINKIVRGQRGIGADTALRLARYFGMSVDFWTGIQVHYDTEVAKMNLGDRLEKEVKVLAPAA